MPQGAGEVREVRVDREQGLLTLAGAEGNLMPAALLQWFYPPLAKVVEPFSVASGGSPIG